MKHILTTLLLAPLAAVDAAEAPRPTRPNIVFILADDLGWADTTLYGHTKLYQTPNLERLAKRGMTFTRAYSASPLCSPTRAAILTGLSPARTGITTPNCHLPQLVLEATPGKSAPPDRKSIQPTPPTRLKTEYRTLAESLRSAGYATGHFGKWHLGPDPYSPLEQGFDVDVPHHPGPGPAGSYVAPWKFKNFNHDPAVPDEHIEDRMAKEAVAWMERNRDRPFYLNYWMFSVHAPFDAKQALIDDFLADTKAVVPIPNPAFDPAQYDPADEGRPKPKPTARRGPAAAAKADAGDHPRMLGWKTRACTAVVQDGVATIRGTGDAPFLGFAPGKLEPGSRLRFRLKCDGGSGQIAWLPAPDANPADAPRPVEFMVKTGEWVEIETDVPAPGDQAGILRLFLPAHNGAVQLDWIELTSGGPTRRWDF